MQYFKIDKILSSTGLAIMVKCITFSSREVMMHKAQDVQYCAVAKVRFKSKEAP